MSRVERGERERLCCVVLLCWLSVVCVRVKGCVLLIRLSFCLSPHVPLPLSPLSHLLSCPLHSLSSLSSLISSSSSSSFIQPVISARLALSPPHKTPVVLRRSIALVVPLHPLLCLL